MAGLKSPRKNTGGKQVHMLGNRPRRFSLIYSSDSSLSDVSDGDSNKVKKMSNNSNGKKSKLIQEGSSRANDGNPAKIIGNKIADDDGTESSDYSVIADDDVDDTSSDDDEEDDDDDNDSDDTSSDDENIDFVKLTAQRKKRAMKALSAIKRGKTASSLINTTNFDIDEKNNNKKSSDKKSKLQKSDENTERNASNGLSFNFKRDGDDIQYETSTKLNNEEDIGEEVPEIKKETTSTDDTNKQIPNINNEVDELHVPKFSESEESEYDIDHDAYFDVINNDTDSAGEIETGEEDYPILRTEEQNIVHELQNDDTLSFDGSIHEEGPDPVDVEARFIDSNFDNQEEDDEEEDEIMSDFNMPFYEDPKFSNLYYYEDSTEPKLSLSTSLPLILNEEKKSMIQKKEAKRRELQERRETRKLLKKKTRSTKTPAIDGDEYIFGVFFQSDDENSGSIKTRYSKDDTLDARLRRLSTTVDKRKNKLPTDSVSSDDEYDNILLDIAHLPTDEEDALESDSSGNPISSSGLEGTEESDDEFDDDSSVTNVFIDIDDLDPDSFYFQNDNEDSSSVYSHSSANNSAHVTNKDGKLNNAPENVLYVDDESTDEDDNLPPPSSRSKNIGSKAKEIVSANVVGLRPPKLGTWETDNKPFSIIDGLSTKSLYALIQEHQQLHEQSLKTQNSESRDLNNQENTLGEELTLNELLNMSELEDDEEMDSTPHQSSLAASDWYNKPKVPLSAFRNKGINISDDHEFMLPSLSTKKVPIGYVGSERTRKKIDKMKELQRQRTEKKRKLKKKRKILKLKRAKARMEKEKSIKGDDMKVEDHHENILSEEHPSLSEMTTPNEHDETFHMTDDSESRLERKNSVKSVGIDEIHEILGKDHSNLLEGHHDPLEYTGNIHDHTSAINGSDADILASLTAPVDFDDFSSKPSLWKQRRQSIVEAAAENLRFTKNGLFSESALADIEGIINTNGPSNNFEFNEVLQ